MIKYLKYIFMAVVTMMAATGCQEDIEDTFSKPIVPELVNNGTILMTQNTMTEAIVWTWSAARFMQGEVTYALYMKYESENAVQVGTSTKEESISMSKTEFQTLLKSFTTIPQNASFNVSFYVEASDASGKYTSEVQEMKVYSYGDVVSAVPVASKSEVVLEVTNLTEQLELLSWEPARLGYNEAITYNVNISYGEGEPVEVATGLTETVCSKTVDEWNELAVKAGAPELQAADLKFTVTAYSEKYPDGIPSEPITVKITTYKATYPSVLSITGTDKIIPQSTSTKGLFDCFVNLGGDTSFKLLDKDSQTEYGSDDAQTATDAKGNVVTSGTINGTGSITLPAGLYRISADLKFNKLQIVKVETIGLIGDATVGAWNEETDMTYDAAANTYTVVTTMTKDKEYKFRANNNWGFAIDKNGDFRDGGDNYKFEKETGEYKIILDLNKHPYTAKVLSTSFPDQLYVPGAHNEWAKPFPVILSGNGEGVYEGGVNLVNPKGENCEWKFSSNNDWIGGDFTGTIELDEYGYGKGTYHDTGGNISTPNGYYYLKVDMTAGAFEMLRIDKVGLIGDFNSWGGDVEFIYDAVKNVWTATQELVANKGFKIRFNSSWDNPNPNNQNRGLTAEGLVPVGVATRVYQNGGNMKVAQDGTYTITLDLSTNPNTVTITK